MEEEKIVTSENEVEINSPVFEQRENEKVFCLKCGSELSEGQQFCPKCGQKVGEILEETYDSKTDTGKNPIKLIIGIAVAVIAVIAIISIVRGNQAKSVTLNKDSVSVKVGETISLTYTIDPNNTKNKTVTWSSSNESIAKVNNGIVSGVNEGDCIITVKTKNGKTDTCSIVTTPAGPDFQAIYYEYCSSSFATVASDSSYLAVDTIPNDIDDHFDFAAHYAIEAINKALGFPESEINRMGQTRSLDGLQSYSNDEVEVTWTYHPDNGLEVSYSLK